MLAIDQRICNAIKRLNDYFGECRYVICGSVSLYIQGINLDRVPHDFDIFIPNRNREHLLRLFRLIIAQSDWILDFPKRPLEGKEVIDDFEFNGLKIKCQTVQSILECKEAIIQNRELSHSDEYYEKQKNDIEKIKLILTTYE